MSDETGGTGMDERLEAEHRLQRGLQADADAAARAILGELASVGAPPPLAAPTDIPAGFVPTNRLRFARWLYEHGRLTEWEGAAVA
jgi:hypothetical protein